MPDVFTKAKRSEVMSRIRSRGNKDTELALMKVFRGNRIVGWRRHVQLRIADLGLRIGKQQPRKQEETEGREMEGSVVRACPSKLSSFAEAPFRRMDQRRREERESEEAVVREEGGGYRVKTRRGGDGETRRDEKMKKQKGAKGKKKQPVRASSRRLLRVGLKVRPDFVFRERKLAVFVDGCFWHGCAKCYVRPRQNRKFWDAKFARNTERDRKVNKALKAAGWQVLRIWEHELKRKDAARLVRKLGRVLGIAD
jgi:DNA mismatch endonuclease Vsr